MDNPRYKKRRKIVSPAASPSVLTSRPKLLLGLSILLLTLALLFGFLNSSKLGALRNELARSVADRDMAARLRVASEKKLRAHEKEFAETRNQASSAEEKATGTRAELAKAQNEKAALEAKLQASESQVAELQKRVADASVGGTVGEAVLPNDLKTQLENARHQLDAAEQEKAVLAGKIKAAQDHLAAMEAEKKRREAGANRSGVHGVVLAVNQAYNFVVLSMGDRQGVVANSEMLVMRAGEFIGKIRISSVEPTTSIGDILTNTLARGVQVQPGDTVIYAGNNNS